MGSNVFNVFIWEKESCNNIATLKVLCNVESSCESSICCPRKKGVLQIVLPANYGADHLVNDDVKSLGTGWLFLITVFLF